MGALTVITLVYITFAVNTVGTTEWIKNNSLQISPEYSNLEYELESPNHIELDVSSHTNRLDKVDTASSESNYEYCKLGGHLEHLSLHCESKKLEDLKEAIADTDQPPAIQMAAMIVSSIAVGCPKTAVFLSDLLFENNNTDTSCDESLLNGPEEEQSAPCNVEGAKNVARLFQQSMRIQYETLSTSLFLSLGCEELGQSSGVDLLRDVRNNTTTKSGILLLKEKQQRDDSVDNENIAIMRYVNKYKNDANNIIKVDEITELPSEGRNGKSTDHGRMRRSTDNVSNEQNFKIKKGCRIVLPLGETLYSTLKSECLQLCLDEDGCQSVGYRNDGSNTCELNTETEKEVGPLFSCNNGDSKMWDYFEKKKDVNYFIISSKSNGKVLEATSETTVRLVSFTSDDNQYWFWKDDIIISKKYKTKVLELKYFHSQSAQHGHLTLGSYRDVSNQRWNFQDETLVSQYDNSRLDIKQAHGVTTITLNHYSSQKWSLSLNRFYFIILGRQSGKVLAIGKDDCSKGAIHLWEYHGGDNQLWFWDDDNIRSKKCPDKVIDFSVSDYDKNGWGKVYMNYFHGGDNQKWKIEKYSFVSQVRDLRLDVKNGNTENGAAVGCHVNNGGFNQQWNINAGINYFFILNKKTGRVMDASSPWSIKQWHYHHGDNQLWFWDGDVIRNKKYTDKVIALNWYGFKKNGWGQLYLFDFYGGSTQKWGYTDEYLLSGYNKLSVEVQGNSETDGSLIGAKTSQTQKWSLIPAHDVFTITSRMNAKVVEVASNDRVIMSTYHGKDNQLWFWNGQTLRSKKYPAKVLNLYTHDYEKNSWGRVYLHRYHDGNNQRWTQNGDFLISSYKHLNLDIKNINTKDGAEIGGCKPNGNLNQKWSFNLKERIYFIIKEAHGDRVLEVVSDLRIILRSSRGGDNQMWFWDTDSIRSKKYPDKVIDLHMAAYNKADWGRIHMKTYHGGKNQRWKNDGDYIISEYENLYLDVYLGDNGEGSRVGGHKPTSGYNQKWIITTPPINTEKSCVDKTESTIYNIVQWIPLVSTLWDLGSSIGYTAAGCTSVAKERAISMSIGAVMDVATLATGGAAAAFTSVAKTGIKVGIKLGVKQGMKTTISITKHSIQNAFKKTIATTGEKGLENVIKTGIKKSGKMMVRETFVDPALFLKNAGKISKKILFHPKRTMKQTWKVASSNIDNLKQLRRKSESLKKTGSGNTGSLRCRRSPFGSCFMKKNPKGYSKSQRKMYQDLLEENPKTETLNKCAERYMSLKGNSFDKEISSAPNLVQTKMKQLDTELEKAELFAMYQYTKRPDVNLYTGSILNGKPILEGKQVTKKDIEWSGKDVNEFSYQAGLMQNYLRKNPIKNPQTVYRYETFDITGHLYHKNAVYTSTKFMSTTKKTSRFRDSGLDLTNKKKYNVELTINLKKSGSDISDISHYPGQEEILIPVNTKFSVQNLDTVDGITKITLTEII